VVILVEVVVPQGRLDDGDRDRLATDITGGLLKASGAPEATMSRARAVTHVWFHETCSWHTGNGPVPGDGPPPVVANVSAPEAWREEMSPVVIGVIRAALGRLDARHGWTRAGGDVWVNLRGVADGSIGLDGRPATAADVVEYVTEEYRASGESASAADLPAGMLLDPVCGMRVRAGATALVLDHEGRVHGFCSRGCREVYAAEHGLEIPA
jgi:YHS domain-containing protein